MLQDKRANFLVLLDFDKRHVHLLGSAKIKEILVKSQICWRYSRFCVFSILCTQLVTSHKTADVT